MSDPDFDIVLSEHALMKRIDDLADRIAPHLTGEWHAVGILLGAMPFTSDLMKALARRGCHPLLDAIWLESYRDGHESTGRVIVRGDITRAVAGRNVLIIDDVFDTGRTLTFAKAHMLAKQANQVITCALARKPWAPEGDGDVDFHAFDAPARFLIGYGMDDAGLYRGLPCIAALP